MLFRSELVYQMGADLARQCRRLGVHVNFAPTVDVNNNPNNPVVSTPNFLLPGIIANGIQTQMFTALRTSFITQYVVSRTANSGGNDQYFLTNANSTKDEQKRLKKLAALMKGYEAHAKKHGVNLYIPH